MNESGRSGIQVRGVCVCLGVILLRCVRMCVSGCEREVLGSVFGCECGCPGVHV